MAERRMFSKKIVYSGRFLRLPASARLLYYDLGMEADDDGFVEGFRVLRITGAAMGDLEDLVRYGFIEIVNTEDVIVHIAHWEEHNSVRKDRYHPSLYHNLLPQPSDNQVTTNGQPSDNQVTTNGQPSDNQVTTTGQPSDNHPATEVRLGKDKKGKNPPTGGTGGKRRTVTVDVPPHFADMPVLQSAFEDWIAYKRERRDIYKPTGVKCLVSEIRKNAQLYGPGAMAAVIRRSISANYRGIVYDWLPGVRDELAKSKSPAAESPAEPADPDAWLKMHHWGVVEPGTFR